MTAIELIESTLKLAGILAEGETPSAEMADDALLIFNQMIDSWSIDNLNIYATQDQQFTWPANTASRTLGPTGNFVGNRPIALVPDPYYKDSANGLSFGIEPISQAQYDAIGIKNLTSTYPKQIFINMDMPNITMYLYPVPTLPLEFHFISANPLSQPATLTTSLVFPPGYLRAFRFNLACELSFEMGGIEPAPTVQKIARNSLKSIKRQNTDPNAMIMALPYPLPRARKKASIFVGGYW